MILKLYRFTALIITDDRGGIKKIKKSARVKNNLLTLLKSLVEFGVV